MSRVVWVPILVGLGCRTELPEDFPERLRRGFACDSSQLGPSQFVTMAPGGEGIRVQVSDPPDRPEDRSFLVYTGARLLSHVDVDPCDDVVNQGLRPPQDLARRYELTVGTFAIEAGDGGMRVVTEGVVLDAFDVDDDAPIEGAPSVELGDVVFPWVPVGQGLVRLE
jgi:hypothetical protein